MNKIVLFLVIILIISCNTKYPQTKIDEILDADKVFSMYARDSGFAKAFIKFAHPDAVILRENSMPIVGKESIKSLYNNSTSDKITLIWDPITGDIATSGELGYTYGVYTLTRDTIVVKGTYVSIWKKDKNGVWKYVLDTGNEGIE